jgi:hypothetical protein
VSPYRGPEKIKPVSQSQESDVNQAEQTKAAADAIVAVLKPMVRENPNLLVKSMQPHHFERMAVDAIGAYIAIRDKQFLAYELGTKLHNDQVEDLYRG